MREVHHVGRRPVLAWIGIAAFATFFHAPRVRAQVLDRSPNVLVFDVAESLLDLQALRPLFQRIFGDGAVVDEWFGETILYSESATLTDTFVPFGQLGAAVLGMLGRIHNTPISKADVAELSNGLASGARTDPVWGRKQALANAQHRLRSLGLKLIPSFQRDRSRGSNANQRMAVSSGDWRVFEVPFRIAFESVCDPKHSRLVERLADDLQAYRHRLRRKAARDRSRWQTRYIKRRTEPRRHGEHGLPRAGLSARRIVRLLGRSMVVSA